MPGNVDVSALLAYNLGKGEVRSSILRCSTTFPQVFQPSEIANRHGGALVRASLRQT